MKEYATNEHSESEILDLLRTLCTRTANGQATWVSVVDADGKPALDSPYSFDLGDGADVCVKRNPLNGIFSAALRSAAYNYLFCSSTEPDHLSLIGREPYHELIADLYWEAERSNNSAPDPVDSLKAALGSSSARR